MIVCVHSFKGGSGKTTICANLSYILALKGKRIGVVDCDLTAPGIHSLYGVDISGVEHKLNQVIWGKCELKSAVINLTSKYGFDEGALYLVPASSDTSDIIRVLNEGYDPVTVTQLLKKMEAMYKLDFLLLDTHPGVSPDTLFTLSVCDHVILSLRHDVQDFFGAKVALEMIKQFDKTVDVVVNLAPKDVPVERVKTDVEEALNRGVTAVIPFSEETLKLGSMKLMSKEMPNSDCAKVMERLAEKLLALKL